MKTNLRERLTMYQCVIKPKVHFAPEFSFNYNHNIKVCVCTEIHFQKQSNYELNTAIKCCVWINPLVELPGMLQNV